MSLIPALGPTVEKSFGERSVRVIKGKQLENYLNMVNSAGFLDGETYDSFLAEENVITKFITIHYFNDGEEIFSVVLGFNSDDDIGALKVQPPVAIDRIFFVQALNLGNEPVGSTMGALFAVGGSNIVFTILQDLNNFFEITDGNLIKNTVLIPAGVYSLVVKAEGTSTQYIDQVNIIVLATALISNINLSNLVIETGSPIGSSVGALSTNGGEEPITYTILAQTEGLTPVDIFEISGTTLQTKDALGVTGTMYSVFIQAEDSRVILPDDERIKVERFTIEVVVDAFINSNSLEFNGVDEHLETPDNPTMGVFTKFSISAWVKPQVTGAAQYIITKFGAGGDRAFGLRVNSAGTVALVFSQTGVATGTSTTAGTIPFNAWSHVVMSYDGTLGTPEINFYIDGTIDTANTTTLTSFASTPVDLLIGALYLTGVSFQSFFSGNIDELSIYNTALSATDASDLYSGGTPTNIESLASAAGIISWWRMGDDFTGGDQPDQKSINDMDAINMNNSNKSTDIP